MFLKIIYSFVFYTFRVSYIKTINTNKCLIYYQIIIKKKIIVYITWGMALIRCLV